MKAVDYLQCYEPRILANPAVGTHALLEALASEAESMRITRKAYRPSAIRALFEEFNRKYNKVASLYNAKHETYRLPKDGLMRHFQATRPWSLEKGEY